jgi:hypothetical protein
MCKGDNNAHFVRTHDKAFFLAKLHNSSNIRLVQVLSSGVSRIDDDNGPHVDALEELACKPTH